MMDDATVTLVKDELFIPAWGHSMELTKIVRLSYYRKDPGCTTSFIERCHSAIYARLLKIFAGVLVYRIQSSVVTNWGFTVPNKCTWTTGFDTNNRSKFKASAPCTMMDKIVSSSLGDCSETSFLSSRVRCTDLPLRGVPVVGIMGACSSCKLICVL